MIKIYGTHLCPDCAYLDHQIAGNPEYQKIDIFEKTANLKEFLVLRDTQDVFAPLRGELAIGIPCFVLEDGRVTLTAEEAGLKTRPEDWTID